MREREVDKTPAPETFDARIGLLIPPPNIMMELEFNRWLPPNVAVNATRMYRSTSDVTVESLLEMARHANDAARLVAMTLPDVIMFGCTSGSLILGVGWDKEVASGIESTTGIRALTTSTAVIEALRTVEARRVAIATPYIDEVNERERRFLEGHGFEVPSVSGMQILKSERIARVRPSEVLEFALAADHPEADALFISCTNLRTMEIVEPLESRLGKPVITSNQASLWQCLEAVGAPSAVAGAGRLLGSEQLSRGVVNA